MKILYFAWLKERIGLGEETLSPPEEVATVAALLIWLRGRGEGHARALADISVVRVAVDQEYARPETPIGNAREIALFPPVTGG